MLDRKFCRYSITLQFVARSLGHSIDAIFDATLNAFAENSQQKSSITEGTRSDYQAPLLGDYSTR